MFNGQSVEVLCPGLFSAITDWAFHGLSCARDAISMYRFIDGLNMCTVVSILRPTVYNSSHEVSTSRLLWRGVFVAAQIVFMLTVMYSATQLKIQRPIGLSLISLSGRLPGSGAHVGCCATRAPPLPVGCFDLI